MPQSDQTPFWVDASRERRTVEGPPALDVIWSANPALIGMSLPLIKSVSIGRAAPGNDVGFELDDRVMSRKHASIQVQPKQRISIIDHESRNGTFVDGERIKEERVLSIGDVIRVGETLMVMGPTAPASSDEGGLLGRSLAMQLLRSSVDSVAEAAASVLILGETGTGKELVARRIHEKSGRPGAFVAVNCGAIPATLAEAAFFGHRKGTFTGATRDSTGFWAAANQGTLFLDEIGELPLSLQPLLLRALDDGRFQAIGATDEEHADVRVVAATNVELPLRVDQGTFRRDLYARLQTVVIEPPPLRERKVDLFELFDFFLSQSHARVHLSVSAAEAMALHDWPMNIRELRALTQRLALIDAQRMPIGRDDLPLRIQAKDSGLAANTEPSRKQLVESIRHFQGNIALIARHFGKDRKQIYRWFEKCGVSVSDLRQIDASTSNE
jgi:DNA-binding NtrC family response regulator